MARRTGAGPHRSNRKTETLRSDAIREMFARVAPRYDLLNRLMTLGLDRRWRREALRRARLSPSTRLLDVGAGTGDLTREALAQGVRSRIVAVDFTPEMIVRGRKAIDHAAVSWVIADVEDLPFADSGFDAVVAGFLLRNVPDVDRTLVEIQRVLSAAGTFACVDTTPSPPGPRSWLARGLMWAVVTVLGRLVARAPAAYRYLLESTDAHLPAHRLAERMVRAGLNEVGYRTTMLGRVAIHWARKALPVHPPPPALLPGAAGPGEKAR